MEEKEFEISLQLALEQMESQPEDVHEAEFKVKQLLDEMRATGMPVPDDLKELVEYLDRKFAAEGGN